MSMRQLNSAARQSSAVSSPASFKLQRSCSCGQHTIGGGPCEECGKSKDRQWQESHGTAARNASSDRVSSLHRNSNVGGDFSGLTNLLRLRGPAPVPAPAAKANSEQSLNPRSILAELGPGQAFGGTARMRMESAFGQSFSHVRLHTDVGAAGIARSLNASALTIGNHVAFASGQYAPGTLVGDALLAHELAHVSQQNGAALAYPIVQKYGAEYDDLERDADASTVQVVGSLWNKVAGFPGFVTRTAGPRLRSGMRVSLNSCFGSGSKDKEGKKTEPTKPRTCDEICNDAYSNSSLNQAGGGVICDGATKCACVFDLTEFGLKKGECPAQDADIKHHEERHLTDVDCDPSKGLHRPPFKDPSQAIASECAHRTESVHNLDEAIKKAGEPCKTKMTAVRNGVDGWVKANCGGP